ncbi:basement membrane-specific heparan sulfate proteoglycan core protein isoform X5 [Rhineura floridana]|uniref:basement membrane-specific heparan sulfate proteoglycan core protein isoform X5 n=1 Tax=Rhineura floridana TaxID=261503 RepID=UPI002AC7E689|nr:basement membrane-specific heparan sulfate proteoglycan core protein isoform X5 [Rhineura floridana]
MGAGKEARRLHRNGGPATARSSGHRLDVASCRRLSLLLAVAAALLGGAQASKRLGETLFPDDTESEAVVRQHWRRYAELSDDEDLLADEASGDEYGSGENGSGMVSPDTLLTTISPLFPTDLPPPPAVGLPPPASMTVSETPDDDSLLIYFRALVNFTKSIDYSSHLDDVNSEEFQDISKAVVDTLESEYYKIPGEQVVSVVFIKEIDDYIFVELDVGSEGNLDENQIREVLFSVIESGSIASYVTSTWGFQFRRLGAAQTPPPPIAMESPVTPVVRACTAEEFKCRSGECITREFLCDRRPDCRDISDELDCAEPTPPECAEEEFACDSGECIHLEGHCDGHPDCGDASDEDGCDITTPRPPVTSARPGTTRIPATTPPVTTRRVPVTSPPRVVSIKPSLSPELRPCRRDEAVCSNKQCIPRDYICDGERDCHDGSDELNCGTPSPCEPNEFKCRNGHCALKLWRCDGDNDCTDGSDELNCPTKGPGDTCAPDQFICVSSRTCIPASYQCDDEADCEDRSDEIGCTPPQVITPPEESIQATTGETVRFTCVAVGVPTPIITWRLNWGHIPSSRRVSITSENGRGTLIIQGVKEADQGAYTCEAINARGMVFGIPDGVLSLTPGQGPCPEGHFHIERPSKCLPCFCFGVTKACRSTSRHRHQIHLRFDTPNDYKGVNVTTPSQPGTLPLSSTQLQIDPGLQEFQLVDLFRRFLAHDSFWTLPRQFLGNKVDSYGGYLRFKVHYGLARGQSEPVQKPNVVIVGNGQKLLYRVQVPTQASVVNQRQIHFIEENWEKESGAPVSRDELLLTLQNLEAVRIQTVYDNRMASVGLSDIVMDTTTTEATGLGVAQSVEECRCPVGYSGLSCEQCDAHFKRVPGGPNLGTCSGCNCNGHSSSCDPFSGYCLNCQHNTEGPQCNKCKPGFFGDAAKGTPTACRPCPCPYTEAPRRFSKSCFLDTDGQATCDACAPGYTGRRCERCAPGYEGNPIQPDGRCVKTGQPIVPCDKRGSREVSDGTCQCKPNVMGHSCNECAMGTFHLSHRNPDGCLRCFCMGVSHQCASSSWSRDQVRVGSEDAERAQFSLSNAASSRTVSEGIRFTGASELTFSSFPTLPHDVYYWVLAERFKGDKVTSYGGELRYTITHDTFPGAPLLRGQPDVLLQGNGIFLEHVAETAPLPGAPTAFTVPFREQAWRRADGQKATREHFLMALADIDVFMIRASYSERPAESRISGIHMDVAVPHPTGLDPALEVEECTCPPGYRGPSCQDCDIGYTRTTSGLYLGTCEPCACSGHAAECDTETGDCQDCRHNTEGLRCERCQPGFFGDARRGTPGDCQPCPCHGPYFASQPSKTCFVDTDGQPTCDSCALGYIGRQCERCAPGYVGSPSRGQPCTDPDTRCHCDPHGSISSQCDASGQCRCKAHAEGPSCSSCRPHHFHLSGENREGCLPCFCMGVTQQCTSSSYYRDLVTSPFLPGSSQGFSLVNRQHTTRIQTGFTVEMSPEGPQLSYGHFGQLGQEAYHWQLPETYLGDKRPSPLPVAGSSVGTIRQKETYFARMRRAHKHNSTSLTEEQLRKDVAAGRIPGSVASGSRVRRGTQVTDAEGSWAWTGLAPVGVAALGWTAVRGFAPQGCSAVARRQGSAHQPLLGRRMFQEKSFCGEGFLRGVGGCDPPHIYPPWTLPVLGLPCLPPFSFSFSFPRLSVLQANDAQMRRDAEIWEMLSHWRASSRTAPPSPPKEGGTPKPSPAGLRTPSAAQVAPPSPPRSVASLARAPLLPPSLAAAPGSRPQGQGLLQGRSQDSSSNLLSSSSSQYRLRASEAQKYWLLYKGFSLLPENTFYWELPEPFRGDKVGSYGGRLRYTLFYNAGGRGSLLPDADVQITGNDITLVAYLSELRPRERKSFEVVFREQYWKRPDGQPATREHLMMALADLDEILIRATYSTDMLSAGITGVSMESAVPTYTSLPRALEVEECRCPPGYQGLSCQDCAAGYTRTGGGLYLGHCALCECNGHSDSCHPETGACSNCLHQAAGEFCEQCAPGFYGDATAGTPEDCQPCACPLLDPENQFSRTCESLGGRGYRCTACEPGYTGQYCEQCAPGYTGNPNVPGQKCVLFGVPDQPPLIVQVHPPRTAVSEGSEVNLRCHVSGAPPHYFYWSREDGRPVPSTAQRRQQGVELHFPSIQPSEAGVYICTCRNPQYSNTSRAEVIVTEGPSKPITVTVEEQRVQSVKPGGDVTFVCTAKSKSPAYTLVWTRQNNGKLPSRAMDFNGILTIRNVQPEDAGIYVCTGSNMFDMDEGVATLYVQAPSKTQMFYGPVEVVEGHRPSAPAVHPMATIEPSQLSVQPGQPAEFRCIVTGNPEPTIEWIGGQGGVISPKAVIRGGILRFPAAEPSDESQYLCRVRNSAGQHMARAFLQVHSASVPQVQVSPERTEVQEGSTVRLYCRAAGSPAATITWEKQGGSLPPQAVSVFGFFHFQGDSLEGLRQRIQELRQSRAERTDIATLVIPSIAAADGGVYLCVGSSAAGVGQARIEVVVLRAAGVSPAVKIESSSSSVIEGQTLDLNCIVASQSAASVTWYRRGGALPANHQVHGPLLRILLVSAADSGEYVCRVSNGAGPKEASIMVTVQQGHGSLHETPPVRIESPSPSVTEGQDLDLNCLIAGHSQPRVTWYKRGGPLPANHQISGYHLRILAATAADSGEYVCRLSDGDSGVVREASIVVTVYSTSQTSGITPPLRIESSSPSVVEGQTLDLNCIVAGQADATVTWYKRGGSLPASHQISGSHLRIPQASMADSGEYVCRVILNSIIREVSVIVSRTGSVPSTLGITPSMRIEASSPHVGEGQTLELDCVIAHQEQAMVTWYKRGGALPAHHQAFGSRLRLVKVSPVDSGEYVCRVSYDTATQEASVLVTIGQGGTDSFPAGVTPPVRIESSSTSPAEGHTLDLKCIIAGPALQARVTWHKRGGTLPASHQVSGSVLRIPQASTADSGEYVCRISDGTAIHEASLMVTIQGGKGSSFSVGVTPPIRIETSSASVVEGQTVDLNCLVAGQSQPRVMWYKQGGALPLNSQIHGSRLRILQASAADSGEYICYVNDGTSPLEASVIVSIPSSGGSAFSSGVIPPVRIESSSSSLAEGQTLELNCLVAAQSQPKVTWFKRGSPLPDDHQVSGTRLRIPQVSSANSGEYVCRVSSAGVTQEAALVVTIQDSESPSHSSGAVPPLRIESSSPSAVEGQTLDLMCIAPGQPHATFTWYRREGLLPAGHRVANAHLRLVQLTPADSGEYVCRVSGGAAPQEASFVVSVLASASAASRLQSPVISIDPHSTAVRREADITFKCRVHDGAQPVEITWKLPNNQLQDNVKISPNGSVITISKARPQNQGAYRCVASNRFGVANSVVNLVVHGPPTVSVMPKGPVEVKVGKSISLDCLGAGEPQALVRWSKVGVRQKVEHQKMMPQDSRAVLQISSAKLEDAGTYVCMAQNTLGTAEAQVEVSVEAVHGKPGAPEVHVNPTQTVVVGQTARLHCSATGDPAPAIRWSKLRAPLPWQHQIVNDTLIIPRAAQQDSGQYICNATNSAGFTEAFIMLDVEAPPYATILPDTVSVQAGELVQLQCLAHGTPPLRYEWTKVNGSLPRHAVVRERVLQISPAAPHDSGTYRCHVSNRVGSAEALAQVRVQGRPGGPLSIQVTPSSVTKAVGGTVEFVCSVVSGEPRARIEWFKEDGELPPHHSISNGVLRIEKLDRGCQGVYSCRVSSPSGQAQESARLTVQALPKVMINIRTSVQTVLVGNAVEFECLAFGDPKPHVTWSKVGGRLRPGVLVSGSMVKIERVEQMDAGQYRCTATNDVGTVQSQVILHVQSVPHIAAQPEVKEVSVGSVVVFPCLASGFPVPDITWTKLEGDLPKDVRMESNILTIPSARPEDTGIYVCTASNRQGKVTAFSMLKVRERVVPYFTQNPQSYLVLPTMKDAYKTFAIEITFRPDVPDALMLYSGMLVYNGQKKNTGTDFVSFGLVGGRPELRFDAGSGMATIRHPSLIKLGEFHTIRLYRNLTQGSLVLDNHTPVNGTSQGKFQGLDLNEGLYLGGYPNYAAVAKTGLSSGFIGCVRQLIIQGKEVIFKDLDLQAHGVSNCPTCQDRPCQNGGVCRDSESSSYVCECPQGFAGSNCEHPQALRCHPEACGPDATCINRPTGQGYTCRCLLGKYGEKCMEGVTVTTPYFHGGDAFISYPPITNIHYELRVDIEIKPLSPDGLILFSGGDGSPVADFVSLNMVHGHLEFRYELGSGTAILQSTKPLELEQWHKITAERLNKDGTLQVNDERPIKRSSPGKSQGLNLRTSMYLGGVDDIIKLPAAVNISSHFYGCIGEVSINGKKVDISYSFLESRGISQCFDSSPCDRRPCQHGGKCLLTGEYEFQCLCLDGYKGEHCEVSEVHCQLQHPCLNGGTCKDTACMCPPGFLGLYCEHDASQHQSSAEWTHEGSGGNDAPGQYGAYFHDGGYVALPHHGFPRSSPDAPETIELEVRTNSQSGLLLWQGVEEGESGKAKDFLSLGLKDGHLVFSYQLGSGEANILSEDPVDDGEWHRVTAIREGKRGFLQVDGDEMITGESPGRNVMVNTKGRIYIGGAPNINTLTAGKYISGITGCIKNVVLINDRPGQQPQQPIDLHHHSEAGLNIQECTS